MMSSSRKIDQLSEASSNHKLLNISVPKKLGKAALDFLLTVFIELIKHLKIHIWKTSKELAPQNLLLSYINLSNNSPFSALKIGFPFSPIS